MIQYLSTFFYSGALVSGSKYVSRWIDSAFAPIVAGLPVGIIGSFFLDTEQSKRRYYAGFMYSSIILAICVFKMYMSALLFPDVSMNTISVIGLALWGIISWITIFFVIVRKS
jgi:hypothetical protein